MVRPFLEWGLITTGHSSSSSSCVLDSYYWVFRVSSSTSTWGVCRSSCIHCKCSHHYVRSFQPRGVIFRSNSLQLRWDLVSVTAHLVHTVPLLSLPFVLQRSLLTSQILLNCLCHRTALSSFIRLRMLLISISFHLRPNKEMDICWNLFLWNHERRVIWVVCQHWLCGTSQFYTRVFWVPFCDW